MAQLLGSALPLGWGWACRAACSGGNEKNRSDAFSAASSLWPDAQPRGEREAEHSHVRTSAPSSTHRRGAGPWAAQGQGGSQHRVFKPYSFLLRQELYIFLTSPVQFHLFQLPEIFFFPSRLAFAFSSYSNPDKVLKYPTSSTKVFQERCLKKGINGLSCCQPQLCSLFFISTVRSHSLICSWISY